MATLLKQLPYDCSTVDNYKAIMQAFGEALAAFGWVKTADAGTVDWATVTTLPANGTYRDWEIWRMNDASQATLPVFMKLEYSRQGTNAPILRVTIGKGSDGAGNITGTLLINQRTIAQTTTVSTGAATLWACYLSGDSGRFMALMWEGAAITNSQVPMCLSIERSRAMDGTVTDEFVTVTGFNVSTQGMKFCVTMTKAGFVTTSESFLNMMYSSTGTNYFNSAVAACPQFVFLGKLSNPLMNICCVPAGDAAEGAQVTVELYGSAHNYIACKASAGGGNGSFGNLNNTGTSSTCALLRYE